MNKNLFSRVVKNEAGGSAYKMSDKEALAQLAVTNCFQDVYYANGQELMEKTDELLQKNSNEFIAKCAIYSRNNGYMKDMPAYLCVYLLQCKSPLFNSVFDKVINNGRMLRGFCKIARSKGINLSAGVVRKAIQRWFNRDCDTIFREHIGNDPSFRDILRMAHPKPDSKDKDNLFGWLIGKKKPSSGLALQYENFKEFGGEIPPVDFRLLSFVTEEQKRDMWSKHAETCGWQALRMNLNNHLKHGVSIDLLCKRLRDRESIKRSKVFPYQILMAYKMVDNQRVGEALQDAMEIATENTPRFENVNVCIDVSGSMSSPVTGNSAASSKVSCVDVAALFASCLVRNSDTVNVVPFDTAVRKVRINKRDSVVTNAQLLSINGGGTDCSCAIRHLNEIGATGDIVMVSDNQSWAHTKPMQNEWSKYRSRTSGKLVCIDIQPYTTVQANNCLNVGGFSDNVFDVVHNYLNGKSWVSNIEEIEV